MKFDYEVTIEKLEAENARLREVLAVVEWGEAEWCDCCKSHQWDGHAENCALKLALGKELPQTCESEVNE